MTECYRCGQDGHRRNDCPTSVRFPPAIGLPPSPDHPTPIPLPVPPRRPQSEIADPAPWAHQIRQRMGWKTSTEEDEARSRGIAQDQAAESRAHRFLI